MRKAALFALLTLGLAVSLSADERHQSYVSYDDGGTIVRTGDREAEATRNVPIYPGDEIVTARRGRSEVSLSDGNIIGIDRATALRFASILDSYEGDSNETVAELRYGKVAVHRTDIGREHVRLDTDQASYVAREEAVYSVETDSRGRDRVTVFDGSVEVRTPQRSTRLRRGETASVDSEGVYDLIADRGYAADDFERWFLKRAERFGTYETKYTDRRVGYWSDDLDSHGRWVFVSGIGWSWRPFVAVGWRPYYNGYWHTSRLGCLTWVSYDPWGWAPWHYGRWAYDGGFGWIWVPGYSYSPAWVYWMYGPSYVGWAPAGWWDCHRPYYSWAYGPYRRGRDFGFGFNGRIRVHDVDLRPWTFVDGNTLINNRIDRAALTTDVIKSRLGRGGNGGYATVSGTPARFTREEVRDPAEAIRRRGLGNDTSGVTGPNTDITSFIRRDTDLGAQVKDRIVRSRPSDGATAQGPTRTIGGASGIPSTGGTPMTIGRGDRRETPSGGSVTVTPNESTPATRRRDPVVFSRGDRDGDDDATSSSTGGTSWRDRVNRSGDRGSDDTPSTSTPRSDSPAPVTVPRGDNSWRNRRGSDSSSDDTPPPTSGRSSSGSSSRGSGDVPARIIDRIGGARVTPRDRGDDGGSSSSTRRRDSGDSGRSSGSVDRGSSRSSGGGSSTRSSGGDGGSSRKSGGSSSGGSTRSSGGSSGGNRESGGRIKRDH